MEERIMSDIAVVVKELIEKAQGYVSHGKVSGKEAEAVDHSIPTDAPKADEKDKETNKANSGTHPKSGGAAGDSDRAEGGEDFKDGSEDTIGPEGKASPGRPGTIKHEHEDQGPDHPGTASEKQKQQKSKDDEGLAKDKDKDKDEDEDEKEDEEKSLESGEVYLDIDAFAEEIVEKTVAIMSERYGDAFNKSQESEFVEAGLMKSIDAALDRLENVERAISNLATHLNVRKSLVRDSDKITGVNNKSLETQNLNKSDVSSRLFDMRMAGDAHVTDQMILKYDATGDLEVLPQIVKSKLGID
jgi:hypothetical protein